MLKAGGDAILSPTLLEALALRLERKEQALLLLNRRGWATSLLCRECGQQSACPNCSVNLTLHDGGRHSLCHYCGHRITAPRACPSCGGAYLKLQGITAVTGLGLFAIPTAILVSGFNEKIAKHKHHMHYCPHCGKEL